MLHTLRQLEDPEKRFFTCPDCSNVFRLTTAEEARVEFNHDYSDGLFFWTQNERITIVIPRDTVNLCICPNCALMHTICEENVAYK